MVGASYYVKKNILYVLSGSWELNIDQILNILIIRRMENSDCSDMEVDV
jgi:hypothetical protein